METPDLNALCHRYAGPRDHAMLARFNRQLIEEHADTGETDLAQLEQRMRLWLGSGQYKAVVFEAEDGQTLAYALFREHRKEIYLRQFLVLPGARRHGVGRRAMNLLQSKIWPPEKRLTVEVMTSNPAAYRFWRAMGYRDCAVTLEIAPRPQIRRQQRRQPAPQRAQALESAI